MPLSALYAVVCCKFHWHTCSLFCNSSHSWPGGNSGILKGYSHKFQMWVALLIMERTPAFKHLLVVLCDIICSRVYCFLAVSSTIPFLAQIVINAFRQSAWYPSLLWEFLLWMSHSTEASLRVASSMVVLLLALLFQEWTLLWPKRVWSEQYFQIYQPP